MYGPSFMQRFIAGLRYVLAVDNDHDSTDLRLLENRLAFITSMRTEYGLDETCWSPVHCVRDADPLIYTSPLCESGGTATIADLATLWREHLHQGLYVRTTGTGGRPHSRRALHAFAAAPRLVSQIRLVITPADKAWGTSTYIDDLAADLRILHPLWEIPADLLDAETTRLHVVLAANDQDMPATRTAAIDIMQAAGMDYTHALSTMDNPRLVTSEPITQSNASHARTNKDLHHASADPLQTYFGIHTTGALFSVTRATHIDTAPHTEATPMPYSWDKLHRAAIHAGWAA